MRSILILLLPILLFSQGGRIYFVNGDVQEFTYLGKIHGDLSDGSDKNIRVKYNSTWRSIPHSKIKSITLGQYDNVQSYYEHTWLHNVHITVVMKNGKQTSFVADKMRFIEKYGFYDDLTEETTTEYHLNFYERTSDGKSWKKKIKKIEFN
jgi:hypothetical protein